MRSPSRPSVIAPSRPSSARASRKRCAAAPATASHAQQGQGAAIALTSLEGGLAPLQERAGAFAHVVGGEHQPELRGLVSQAFLDAALAAVIDAVEHPA